LIRLQKKFNFPVKQTFFYFSDSTFSLVGQVRKNFWRWGCWRWWHTLCGKCYKTFFH